MPDHPEATDSLTGRLIDVVSPCSSPPPLLLPSSPPQFPVTPWLEKISSLAKEASHKDLAEWLHKNRYAYNIYGVLDPLSSAYSMLKFLLEVSKGKSSLVEVKEVLSSPEILVIFLASTTSLVLFSSLATYWDGKEGEDLLKKKVVGLWPYARDVLKAVKNAYKGTRSVLHVMQVLCILDALNLNIKNHLVPLGLGLGVVGIANRIWNRQMVERRKTKMDATRFFLEKVEKGTLSDKDWENILEALQPQEHNERTLAFVSAAVGGWIDGWYMYGGLINMAIVVAMPPPLLLTIAALCVFYTASCIVMRVFEEYDFQQKLIINQSRCRRELALNDLLKFANERSSTPVCSEEKQKELDKRIHKAIQTYKEEGQKLKAALKNTSSYAFLIGLKSGVLTYGVLTSFTFTLTTLASITFSPVVILACALSGLVFMGLFIGFYQYYLNKGNPSSLPASERLSHLQKLPGFANEYAELFEQEDLKSLNWHKIPEFLEIFRSAVSGIGKGANWARFLEFFLEKNLHLLTFLAVVFCLPFTIRAFARGYGRDPASGTVSATTKDSLLSDNPSVPDASITNDSFQGAQAFEVELGQGGDSDALSFKGPSLPVVDSKSGISATPSGSVHSDTSSMPPCLPSASETQSLSRFSETQSLSRFSETLFTPRVSETGDVTFNSTQNPRSAVIQDSSSFRFFSAAKKPATSVVGSQPEKKSSKELPDIGSEASTPVDRFSELGSPLSSPLYCNV